MSRRKTNIKVEKTDQVRADHVKGMSDVAFRGFNCLSAACTAWIVVRDDEIGDSFEIACSTCGYVHRSDEEVKFFDYTLRDMAADAVIEEGEFTVLVAEYVDEAQRLKYCIYCNALKPLSYFDNHSARRTKRQGECNLCKQIYNSIKNQTRTADQHREAAQKRRLYIDLSGPQHLDQAAIIKRFGGKCFKCTADVSGVDNSKNRRLDHTLPAMLLWPLTTENATLLCQDCNGAKSGSWPSTFYSDTELRRLSALTGIDYAVLTSEPHFNPEAIARLQDVAVVDELVTKYAPYMDEIIRVRNRVLDATDTDIFEVSSIVSPAWVRAADEARQGRVAKLVRKAKKARRRNG